MKRLLPGAALAAALILASACRPFPDNAPKPEAATAAAVPYGANNAAGGTFDHDGVTLYYETYGQGEPLLLVHGNGGSIGTLGAQIEHFKASRKVIAMDSRDQGRSGDSQAPITYEKMADDLAALIDHLETGPVDVVGWSDGGIEALLLGARHPTKVRKLVAMAANLNPSAEALYPETQKLASDMTATATGRALRVGRLMLSEPHIDPASLAKVTAPTLVLSGDLDLIRLEHTVRIYNALPNANLAVFPNSTHMVPFDDPQLFNATVQRFLETPFRKKDRIGDTMASFEKLFGGLAK
jgi:pimeloyl-ACP methyl ester carboxylesterase